MKNQDLYALKEVINRVKEKGNNKFKLPLIMNEIVIDERIGVLSKLREQSKEFKEFEGQRRELISKHAEKDESGNVVIYSEPNGAGDRAQSGYGYPNIINDIEVYKKKLADLQVEYSDSIEKEVSKEKEFNETLSQSIEPEIKFHKIAFDQVPEIGYEELKVLMPLVG